MIDPTSYRAYNDQIVSTAIRELGCSLDAEVFLLCECNDAACEVDVAVRISEHLARIGTRQLFVAEAHADLDATHIRSIGGRYSVVEPHPTAEVDPLRSELATEVIVEAFEHSLQQRELEAIAHKGSLVDSILELTGTPMVLFDLDGRIAYCNGAANVLGMRWLSGVVGRTIAEVHPDEFGHAVHDLVRRVARTGDSDTFTIPGQMVATTTWRSEELEGRLAPLTDATGAIVGVGCTASIPPEANEARLDVLVELGRIVDRHGEDPEALLQATVDMLVPRFVDLVVLDLLVDGSHRIGPVRHVDDRMTNELLRATLGEVQEGFGVPGRPSMRRMGATTYVPDVTDALLDAIFAQRPVTRRVLARAGTRSLITVPLASATTQHGSLTCAVDDSSGRRLSRLDLRVVEEVGTRIGTAYERARHLLRPLAVQQ